MKRLMVITGWTSDGFAKEVNYVFANPNIEVIRTEYCNSWCTHYAYIEYEEKDAVRPRTQENQ
jgi:hypothetical protein